jgi:hypothetical protein
VDDELDRPKEVSAKVVVYEVTIRPGYELVTDARRDDHVFVGMPEWRRQRVNKKPAGAFSGPARS